MSATYRIHPDLNAAVVRYADVVARRHLQHAGVPDHGYDENEHRAAAEALNEWLGQATRCMDAVIVAHLQTGNPMP